MLCGPWLSNRQNSSEGSPTQLTHQIRTPTTMRLSTTQTASYVGSFEGSDTRTGRNCLEQVGSGKERRRLKYETLSSDVIQLISESQ